MSNVNRNVNLDGLSKAELVTHAESLRIEGAHLFTRLELLDEVRRAEGLETRGFLGKARDLLRSIVERGLSGTAVEPSLVAAATDESDASSDGTLDVEVAPEPAESRLLLAEIALAQGQLSEAIRFVTIHLENTPNDPKALTLLKRWSGVADSADAAVAALEITQGDEPVGIGHMSSEASCVNSDESASDGAEPTKIEATPKAADLGVGDSSTSLTVPNVVDEVIAMPVDGSTLLVHWSTSAVSQQRAGQWMEFAGGKLRESTTASDQGVSQGTLRVLVVQPHASGPRSTTRDLDVVLAAGQHFVHDLPPGSIVRAAIGVSSAGRFLPITHTLDIETPRSLPHVGIALQVMQEDETSRFVPAIREVKTEQGSADVPRLLQVRRPFVSAELRARADSAAAGVQTHSINNSPRASEHMFRRSE